MVEQAMNKIAFPDAESIIDAFELDVFYSDITYEDLSKPAFLEELVNKGLIEEADENEIANFQKAIALDEKQSSGG